MSGAAGSAAAVQRRVRHHYFNRFADDPRRERLFLSSLGFDAGAITARAVTHMIRHGIGPFRNLTAGGRHLHHLVFGIGGLLATGYAWLVIADDAEQMRAVHRATAFLYGAGSALTQARYHGRWDEKHASEVFRRHPPARIH